MNRSGLRWWAAGLLTLAAFLGVTWAVTVTIPGDVLGPLDLRVLVGTGAGTAVAALVALWGKKWATTTTDSGGSEPVATDDVAVTGPNHGIIATGSGSLSYQGEGPLPPDTGPAGAAPLAEGSARSRSVRVGGRNDGIISTGDRSKNVQRRP
ncbi:hypothetical protein [Streptacidiphilus anmyonensis]|uniref:hypothetical protein n=1 Tax=Streptacidiphilus anmyonensis TaxID=405782 RepID=UPI0005A97DA3|nr:hypothetical protein [Streptacidiphilus anmyonensis]